MKIALMNRILAATAALCITSTMLHAGGESRLLRAHRETAEALIANLKLLNAQTGEKYDIALEEPEMKKDLLGDSGQQAVEDTKEDLIAFLKSSSLTEHKEVMERAQKAQETLGNFIKNQSNRQPSTPSSDEGYFMPSKAPAEQAPTEVKEPATPAPAPAAAAPSEPEVEVPTSDEAIKELMNDTELPPVVEPVEAEPTPAPAEVTQPAPTSETTAKKPTKITTSTISPEMITAEMAPAKPEAPEEATPAMPEGMPSVEELKAMGIELTPEEMKEHAAMTAQPTTEATATAPETAPTPEAAPASEDEPVSDDAAEKEAAAVSA